MRIKEVEIDIIERQISKIMADKENVEKAFHLSRGFIVFTTNRIILVDKKGMTSKRKREFLSVPYGKINFWTVECKKNFDISGKFKFFIQGLALPVVRKFKNQDAMYEMQKLLSFYCKKN